MLKQFLFSPGFYFLAFLFSAVTMLVIDYFLGKEAEYLNAWNFVVTIFNKYNCKGRPIKTHPTHFRHYFGNRLSNHSSFGPGAGFFSRMSVDG